MSDFLKNIILILFLLFLVGLHLIWGSVHLTLLEVWEALFGYSLQKQHLLIIWEFRLPKIITTLLAGMSLSISGLLMQTFFRNPVAGPFVLGISSGASLGVAILILASGWLASWGIPVDSTWSTIMMAMLGAGSVLAVLLVVSYRIRDINTLLILGLMFGSATGAIVTLLQYFSNQQDLQQFVFWSMGSLSAVTWDELYILMPVCILTVTLTLGLSKTLDALLLGEQYARSMGVSVKRSQQLIIGATAILAGGITAFCGPIAFIGIAVPHLGRMLFRTHRHLVLIQGTALLGMITLLFCQLIAQLPGSSQMIPINVVTSFMGAPMVIWIILGKKNKA
jgi:iron complex transport system permease protein